MQLGRLAVHGLEDLLDAIPVSRVVGPQVPGDLALELLVDLDEQLKPVGSTLDPVDHVEHDDGRALRVFGNREGGDQSASEAVARLASPEVKHDSVVGRLDGESAGAGRVGQLGDTAVGAIQNPLFELAARAADPALRVVAAHRFVQFGQGVNPSLLLGGRGTLVAQRPGDRADVPNARAGHVNLLCPACLSIRSY